MTVRVLIAEAHPELRAALRAIVSAEPGIELVGEASDSVELFSLAGAMCPNVVVLDINLPDSRGLVATRRLRRALPDTKILLITSYEDTYLVRDALLAGAAGCIVSQSADTTLAGAIRAISEDGLHVLPGAVWGLLTELLPTARVTKAEETSRELTPREVDVLCLVAGGYTNRQAARELGLSVRTIETHRERIMEKIGAHSRADLVRYATELRLTEAMR